ncbi:MAG: glycosyltransferase family 9 protein [Planctomycetota bacterium]
MATPMLRALRRAYPQSELVGIMSPIVQEVIEGAWGDDERPWFDEYILFRKGRRKLNAAHRAQGVTSRRGIIRQLRQLRVDVALLTTNSWWTAAVSRFGGVRKVVGYDRDSRRYLLHEPLPVPKSENGDYAPISAVDYYLALASWVGGDTERSDARSMQLRASDADLQLADKLWHSVGFRGEVPTVVVNSNSAKDSARVWPESHVIELTKRLVHERDVQVLLHCGPGERESANRIAASVDHPSVASMGHTENLPIGLSRGVLKRAAVVVSTDSGARHMAVALDRPVVSLFGPTSSAWTRTYNTPELELAEDLDCRACYQSECPLKHHACMQNLSVNRVMDAVASRLGEASYKKGHLIADATESEPAVRVA